MRPKRLAGRCALLAVAVCALGACASTPDASHPSTQVGAGTSSSIDAGGVKSDTPDDQQQKLNGALTPETRKKLQEAMESQKT